MAYYIYRPLNDYQSYFLNFVSVVTDDVQNDTLADFIKICYHYHPDKKQLHEKVKTIIGYLEEYRQYLHQLVEVSRPHLNAFGCIAFEYSSAFHNRYAGGFPVYKFESKEHKKQVGVALATDMYNICCLIIAKMQNFIRSLGRIKVFTHVR